MAITLYNSLAGEKQEFKPIDENNVRMYVCGPTVYNRPHVGNARAVVVYDVLYRLLKADYKKVTYVRNITDVDDKINAAAKENGEDISDLAGRIEKEFHEDMNALNNLEPTKQPRATEHMAEIIALIEKILENNHAYEAEGHVLFDVSSVGSLGDYFYGKLSGKKLEDLIAGARVEVEGYKKSPSDFVLWKPSKDDEPGWDSPWGRGRPGWHIECSAMSTKYLGDDFDIHGGGADLKFPHHENEIAQSCCGSKGSSFAKYWVHNGFVTVNGEKMAKSAGNFTTVRELLDKGIKGEVIRYVLLATQYRKPLDFSDKSLSDAKKNLDGFYRALETFEDNQLDPQEENESITKRTEDTYNLFLDALRDDLNTPEALAHLYTMAKGIRSVNASEKLQGLFKNACNKLGIVQETPEQWFGAGAEDLDADKIEELIAQRDKAKKNKDFESADKLRDELTNMGIIIEDSPSGTKWRKA